ncbi:hypothetical protein OAE39_00330 [Akkermansiaceae bacterium]|nr:hypothetical protein [Akkermansiaceae bacterium]
MNHHLRFARQSVSLWAIGIALLLSSCSSSKIEPPLAASKKGITYEIRIFDVPAKHDFGNQHEELMTPQQAADLLGKLDRQPSFSAVITGQPGQTKKLTSKKDFVYPTEWTPPQFSNTGSIVGGSGEFPVTPATPKSFITTQVGTTTSFTGQRSPDGFVDLEFELNRKAFLGFINYGKPITTDASDWLGRKVPVVITENRMEKPVFDCNEINSSSMLSEGNYLILRNPDAEPVNSNGLPFQEKRPPGFIAVIRVASR